MSKVWDDIYDEGFREGFRTEFSRGYSEGFPDGFADGLWHGSKEKLIEFVGMVKGFKKCLDLLMEKHNMSLDDALIFIGSPTVEMLFGDEKEKYKKDEDLS